MIYKKILGVSINPLTKKNIREKIIKFVRNPKGILHIVSLNPENLVVATDANNYKKVIATAQIKIIDGTGIVIASKILGVPIGERITGVGLMEEMIKLAQEMRLRVLLIGGKPNLAEKIANCQSDIFPEATFQGITGIADIKKPRKEEEREIFSIVSHFKPHFVFVAFGSPAQELWIDRHKGNFQGSVVMGVGGAFDYFGGAVKRAPLFMRKIGLEWLFRLLNEPWRSKRQLRLIEFIWLVLLQRFNLTSRKKSKKFFVILRSSIILRHSRRYIRFLKKRSPSGV